MSVMSWVGPNGEIFTEESPLGRGDTNFNDSTPLMDTHTREVMSRGEAVRRRGYGGEAELDSLIQEGEYVTVSSPPIESAGTTAPTTPLPRATGPGTSDLVGAVASIVTATAAAIVGAMNLPPDPMATPSTDPTPPSIPDPPIDPPKGPKTPVYDPYLLLARRRKRRKLKNKFLLSL